MGIYIKAPNPGKIADEAGGTGKKWSVGVEHRWNPVKHCLPDMLVPMHL